MFVIRLAASNEFNKVRQFYHSLTEKMQYSKYSPGWKKDIYPEPEFLRKSINKKEFYVGELDGDLAAVMVINHDSNEGYQKVQWPTAAEKQEIYVVHALGVHPDFSGKGLAKAMIKKVFSLGRSSGIKVVRLDVLEGNIPAEKLYVGIGFQYIDTIQMYYEDTGWTNYQLYEYVL